MSLISYDSLNYNFYSKIKDGGRSKLHKKTRNRVDDTKNLETSHYVGYGSTIKEQVFDLLDKNPILLPMKICEII